MGVENNRTKMIQSTKTKCHRQIGANEDFDAGPAIPLQEVRQRDAATSVRTADLYQTPARNLNDDHAKTVKINTTLKWDTACHSCF
jgi:hypothetical protein